MQATQRKTFEVGTRPRFSEQLYSEDENKPYLVRLQDDSS